MKLKHAVIKTILSALVIITVATANASAQDLHFVFPDNNVFVTNPKVRLVGYAEPAVNEVIIRLRSGKNVQGTRVKVSKGVFTTRVKLQPGLNVIEAMAGQKQVIDARSLYFFDSSMKNAIPPKEYLQYFVHADIDLTDNCTSCHNIPKSGKADFARRINPINDCTNGGCHSEISSARFVHGPVAGQTCVACHNPHGSVNADFMSRVGDEICLVCHGEGEGFIDNPRVVKEKCLTCHDPHKSENNFHLKPGFEMKDKNVHSDFSQRRGEK